MLKCTFLQKELPYLGHVTGNGKILSDTKRVTAIQDFPIPRNLRELRRFIGMAQFCRRFIKDLNLILAPLYNLTKAKVEFSWSQECQITFARVKSLLTEPPVLVSPSIYIPREMDCWKLL